MSAIDNDAPHQTDIHPLDMSDDVEGAFLKLWKDEDAEKPSETDSKDESETKKKKPVETKATEDAEEPSDEAAEEEEDSEDSNTEDSEETDEKPAKKIADDDHVTVVKVDGQELEVSVKELKRLYGQEQSLTRKSEEVSHKSRQVEEAGKAHMVGLNKLLESARARVAPFAQIDFALAATQLAPEEYTALKQEAENAYRDLNFLEQELGNEMERVKTVERQQLQVRATECIKELTHPERGIPGWNESLYNDLRAYALTNGGDVEEFNRLVDPVSFKILHKAYLYDKGKAVQTTKVVKEPKKIIKTAATTGKTMTNDSTKDKSKAMSRHSKTGDLDDIADAFLANWKTDD